MRADLAIAAGFATVVRKREFLKRDFVSVHRLPDPVLPAEEQAAVMQEQKSADCFGFTSKRKNT
jgi:hypothetical protein